MREVVAYVLPLALFLALYVALQRRAIRRAADGLEPAPPPF